MKDRYKEDRNIENAVDICTEAAKYQINPFRWLYHNPHSVHSMQYFAHWVQRWATHRCYMVLVRSAQITGYEPVPASLLYENAKRDGFGGRKVKVGKLSFYLIKTEEMSLGLERRYTKFKEMLYHEVTKDKEKYKEERAHNTSG